MLVFIKTLHTAIWVGFNVCFALAFACAYQGRFDAWFWVPFGLIVAECVVIVANRWTCPLTPWAARYTDDRADNFDIYLPLWVARYNKQIYSVVLVVGAAAVAWANLAR